MEESFSRRFVTVHVWVLILSTCYAEVINFGVCKDPDCSGPLALGETTSNYHAADQDKISFGIGQEVKIFSKGAGRKTDLLGVEINGNRGYVPKSFVRETKDYKYEPLVPAKSKFGVLSDTPGSIKNKSAEDLEHSTSDSEPVPSLSSPESSHSTVSQPVSSKNNAEDDHSGTGSNLHSPKGSDEDPATHSESEIGSERSHSSEAYDVDVHDSDVGESSFDSGETVSPSQSDQNDSETVIKSDSTTTATNALHSSEQSESPGQPLGTVSSIEGNEAPDVTTDVQNINSHSAVSTEFENSNSARTSIVLDSSMSSDLPRESMYPAEAKAEQHTDVSTEILSVADVTKTVSRVLDMVSESFSEDSLRKHKDNIQQSTSLSLETIYQEELSTVKDEIDATLSLLEERGYNTSDIVAESNFDSESDVESAHENSVYSKTVEVGDDYHRHSKFPRKPPLAQSLTGSLKNSDTPLHPEHHSQEKKINSWREGLPGDEVSSHKVLTKGAASREKRGTVITSEGAASQEKPGTVTTSEDAVSQDKPGTVSTSEDAASKDKPGTVSTSEDAVSKEKQGTVITTESAADVEAPFSEVHSQNSHDSVKYPNMHSDSAMANSQENSLHTSFNGANHGSEYVSDAHPPVPDHQSEKPGMVQHTEEVLSTPVDHSDIPGPVHDSLHPDVGISDKNQMQLPQVEHFSSESTVFNTRDISGASVQSESHAAAQTLDYSSSPVETSFISRHLKSEMESDAKEEDVQYERQEVLSDTSSLSLSMVSEVLNNTINAMRSFTEAVILWLPEPVQLYLVDLQSKGVPPKATVFTAVIAIPTAFLFITIIYIRKSSKEKKILVKLSDAEQKLFSATTERNVLKEDIGKLSSQLSAVENDLEQEKKSVSILKKKLEKSENFNQSSNAELKAQLKDLESQVEMKTDSVSALQTALEQCKESNSLLQRKLQEEENAVSTISVQLQEFEEEVRTLQKEKEDLIQKKTDYKEKVVELDLSCNQLLQEAEVWNSRVNELTEQLQSQTSCCEELENGVQSKDSEIQSLQHMVQSLQVIQELKDSDDADENIIEEKMKEMLDTSAVQIKLKKAEDERDAILKTFESERNRVMELEVELLEAKSETEKLKSNYNQALQDKTEAQTKLEVLSNYFKDKEMQLQKELGVQEAVRQQKEEDASFAARRVNLIEEENSSYKYQVATLKQEIEETERNFKNQVALQEKKAHENWLAARAAERKVEDTKQETAQLRQRLTLLEREQENWLNSSRDEIVRPVPKRPGGANGEIGPQDVNRSKDSSSGSLPLPHEMIPPHHPVLPLDRPLPPMRMPMMEPRGFHPPPPIDPYFDFVPFPPQPWHARGPHPDPLHPLDRRTPSTYERGRFTPPPRRHHSPTVSDRAELERRSASPKDISSRGSHTSSPPHPLPHFHDIPPPPPPGSYDFHHPPPPPLNSRFPLPPPPRREFLNHAPGLRRTDSRNSDMITSTPRGAHQVTAAQDRRQNQQPSSRV